MAPIGFSRPRDLDHVLEGERLEVEASEVS